MDIVSQIKDWGQAFLPADVFVVEVVYKPTSKKLSVFIDADQSLTIEQCRLFNRFLSEKLDETDFSENPYTLEVSSPGVDRPLALPRQYNKHIGRELKVKLLAQTELLGKLTETKENTFVLQLKDKKKGYNAKSPSFTEVAFNDVAQAVVQINFN